MQIHIFGNSFSYGLEIDREAMSLLDLRNDYKEMGGPHIQAWPNLISPKLSVVNQSVGSSGFWSNVSRALIQDKKNSLNPSRGESVFLIDASLQQHLFLEDQDKSKAPVFFKKDTIQKIYQKSLDADVVHFQIWNASQLLIRNSIRFYFFFSYSPYWFGRADEDLLFSEIEYEKYAVEFRESFQWPSEINLPNQIKHLFLDSQPLISYVEGQHISKYGHIKNKEAHRIIADIIFNQLQRKTNDFIANN